MLRPKQMSRVSVTGTRRVMETVIETTHDLNLVHFVDYADEWDGFDQGRPMPAADKYSEDLVTVRSIESILGVDRSDVDTSERVPEDEMPEELERIRTQVNELDDRRNELRGTLREIDERISAAEPFVDLGIDLDLLTGYDSLTVRVGEGTEDRVRDALDSADIDVPYEIFAGDQTVGIFAPSAGADTIDNILVSVEFTAIPVPESDESNPDQYVTSLRDERATINSKIDEIDAELESLKQEAAQFLLATEERLTIEVQKKEAPLRFATTANAFIAEGWIPTERLQEFVSAIQDAAGEFVEIEELEQISYDPQGHPHEEAAATDGGTTMSDHEPPVIQDNPSQIKSFELLVKAINQPRYWELDPTIIVFLTFPTFFGFMIGDLGYGFFYTLIGYLLFTKMDSPGIKSLGGIAMWAGIFTMLFGVLYGEIFGLHILGELIWGGHPPIEKGLSDATAHYALLWLVVAMLLGLMHVGIGYLLDFVNTVRNHPTDAFLESGSWAVLMFGIWTWILSTHARAAKPDLLFVQLSGPPLGFTGFSPTVGLGGLLLALLGLVLVIAGEVRHEGALGALIGILESPNVLVNILSYARVPAVLLAKAGMAFVVNLLVFGAYVTEDGATHFMHSTAPAAVHGEILFAGLFHGGIAAIIGGILVLVIGHAIVLALGITSAGLQAVRLEYVEFFQKFYEGGGDPYEPFGYDRTFTTD